MDYCDIHAYWNHPVFPRREWDQNDWYIRNRALVNDLHREILPTLASKRVYGKPFTVSEYNHPFPNYYAAEGLPLLAAFGAFQDWDGFFPFAYSHSRDAEPQQITGFFDTAGNTVQTAHMIACKVLFDAEFDVATIVAPLTAEKEREIYKKDRMQYNIGFSGLGLNPAWALRLRTAVDVSGKVKEMPTLPPFDIDPNKWSFGGGTPNGHMTYHKDPADATFCTALTTRAILFTGFMKDELGVLFDSQPNQVQLKFDEKPNLGWATATLTRLDDEKGGPERYLFVITGETRNTDMQFETLGDDRITVGNRWGRAPVLCEGVAAKLIWEDLEPQKLRCWALDQSGNRGQEISIGNAGGAVIETKPEYKTIWYEIEVY
jgi:hypothetical protein